MDGPVMRRRRGKKVFLSRFVPSVPVVTDLDGANLDDRPLRFPDTGNESRLSHSSPEHERGGMIDNLLVPLSGGRGSSDYILRSAFICRYHVLSKYICQSQEKRDQLLIRHCKLLLGLFLT